MPIVRTEPMDPFPIVGADHDWAPNTWPGGRYEFDGHLFSLPITPFTLPQNSGMVLEDTLASDAFSQTRDFVLERSSHFLTTSYNDVLTMAGPGAFRITVAIGGEAALKVFRGIPDQDFMSTRTVSVQVPVDAFVHTQEEAVVHLTARMVDGGPLPAWLTFDPTTGKFRGVAPEGAPRELAVLVEARDRDGRRAEAVFRIKLAPGAVAGRSGLTEQIRAASRPASPLDVLRNMPSPAPRPQAAKVAA
jgi:hypothetical protein